MQSSPPDNSSKETTGFVADYLLYLLAAASEGASAQFHEEVRNKGLRVPEWRVLACLNDLDGAMITHLAKISLFEQSRLTRIIAQMEERGLVVRQGDPKDGRRVRVFLTDEGRNVAGELVPQAKKHEASLLAQLDQQKASDLKPALQALLATLQKSPDGNR